MNSTINSQRLTLSPLLQQYIDQLVASTTQKITTEEVQEPTEKQTQAMANADLNDFMTFREEEKNISESLTNERNLAKFAELDNDDGPHCFLKTKLNKFKRHKLAIIQDSIHFRRNKGDGNITFFEHKLQPGHVRKMRPCKFQEESKSDSKRVLYPL